MSHQITSALFERAEVISNALLRGGDIKVYDGGEYIDIYEINTKNPETFQLWEGKEEGNQLVFLAALITHDDEVEFEFIDSTPGTVVAEILRSRADEAKGIV